jgi:hypothetical protein
MTSCRLTALGSTAGAVGVGLGRASVALGGAGVGSKLVHRAGSALGVHTAGRRQASPVVHCGRARAPMLHDCELRGAWAQDAQPRQQSTLLGPLTGKACSPQGWIHFQGRTQTLQAGSEVSISAQLSVCRLMLHAALCRCTLVRRALTALVGAGGAAGGGASGASLALVGALGG